MITKEVLIKSFDKLRIYAPKGINGKFLIPFVVDCTDAGHRATQGAVAERLSNHLCLRGYEQNRFIQRFPKLALIISANPFGLSLSKPAWMGASINSVFKGSINRSVLLSLVLLFLNLADVSAEEIAKPALNCQLKTFDQTSAVDLEQFKGQVVYVDFWASWCGPCVESFPFMNKLHNVLKTEGLALLAVNLDEDLADAKSFLDAHKAEFTVVTDTDQQCAKQFAVKAMPSSYLIDRKGMIREVHLGFRPGEAETFEAKVKQLLAESP